MLANANRSYITLPIKSRRALDSKKGETKAYPKYRNDLCLLVVTYAMKYCDHLSLDSQAARVLLRQLAGLATCLRWLLYFCRESSISNDFYL